LADRLGIALMIVVLRVNFVIHVGKPRKPVRAVLPDNVRLNGVGAGVGEVND